MHPDGRRAALAPKGPVDDTVTRLLIGILISYESTSFPTGRLAKAPGRGTFHFQDCGCCPDGCRICGEKLFTSRLA